MYQWLIRYSEVCQHETIEEWTSKGEKAAASLEQYQKEEDWYKDGDNIIKRQIRRISELESQLRKYENQLRRFDFTGPVYSAVQKTEGGCK